ncbi:MAG: hypothetical protein H0U59_08865 [Gemmatimonadaceae bacterium]|nr:hypothetical protein [Gemmatimonadaceae bacterium]MDQ3242431.1 hypothetical protein [Gemmatimonadota bacterium]
MRPICFGLYLVTSVAAAAQGSVTGTLTVNAASVTLKFATAVAYTNGTDRSVSVLLSDKPANAKTFAEYTRIGANERYVPGIFEGAWASLHVEKEFSGFTFSVDASNKILTNQILVGGENGRFSVSSDDLVLEVTSVSPRFTGRIRSKQPVLDLGDRKVSLDATFDALVSVAGK